MQIDLLEPPECLYYEDDRLQKLENTDDPCEIPADSRYQISKMLVVQESICRVGPYKKAKWPVRLMKWIVEKLPNSWKAEQSGQICCGTTTINCMYPVIKYLVEKKDWCLNDAAVACANMCERCMNLLLRETDPNYTLSPMPANYFDKGSGIKGGRGTWCKNCKTLDPEYDKKHRVWCVYRTKQLGGDVARAFKETSCFSSPDWGWEKVK